MLFLGWGAQGGRTGFERLVYRLAYPLAARSIGADALVNAGHNVRWKANGQHHSSDVALEWRATHSPGCARSHCYRQFILR